LSEERFMKDNVEWVDQLKLRASYGESGNLAGGPFQYSNAMSLSGNAYNFGGSILQGVNERSEANPYITWERAVKSNVGLEGAVFNNLLSFEVDYFYEKRNNMMQPRLQPLSNTTIDRPGDRKISHGPLVLGHPGSEKRVLSEAT